MTEIIWIQPVEVAADGTLTTLTPIPEDGMAFEIEGLRLRGYILDPIERRSPFTHLLRTTATKDSVSLTFLAQLA